MKNQLVFTSAVFLKKQTRIVALGAVMLISLLVYSSVQYKIRKALVDENESIPSQTTKPTQKPTARWIFSLFEGVIINTITIGGNVQRKPSNLREVLEKILNLLGEPYKEKYLL